MERLADNYRIISYLDDGSKQYIAYIEEGYWLSEYASTVAGLFTNWNVYKKQDGTPYVGKGTTRYEAVNELKETWDNLCRRGKSREEYKSWDKVEYHHKQEEKKASRNGGGSLLSRVFSS